MANPVYHDPSSRPTRGRRSSSRKSFATPLSRSNTDQESLRVACSKTGDSFSFNAEYLKGWTMEDEHLWNRLPTQLRSDLTEVQHAGAAVQTSSARLQKNVQDFEMDSSEQKFSDDEELLGHFDDLPPPKFESAANANSIFNFGLASPPATESSFSTPGSASPAISAMSLSQAEAPLSPFSRGSPALDSGDARSLSRSRSFSVGLPLDPQDSYYVVELSHMRTDAVPRLRHAARKVDIIWIETKATGVVSTEDVETFEKWWKEKREIIAAHDEECTRLAAAAGLTSAGMGWTAQ